MGLPYLGRQQSRFTEDFGEEAQEGPKDDKPKSLRVHLITRAVQASLSFSPSFSPSSPPTELWLWSTENANKSIMEVGYGSDSPLSGRLHVRKGPMPVAQRSGPHQSRDRHLLRRHGYGNRCLESVSTGFLWLQGLVREGRCLQHREGELVLLALPPRWRVHTDFCRIGSIICKFPLGGHWPPPLDVALRPPPPNQPTNRFFFFLFFLLAHSIL